MLQQPICKFVKICQGVVLQPTAFNHKPFLTLSQNAQRKGYQSNNTAIKMNPMNHIFDYVSKCCHRDKDFHKNSPCHMMQIVATTCPCIMSKRLILDAHMLQRPVTETCCLVCPELNDTTCNPSIWNLLNLRRNPPDVGVTSGQKPCTKIIYVVLQTSVGLF